MIPKCQSRSVEVRHARSVEFTMPLTNSESPFRDVEKCKLESVELGSCRTVDWDGLETERRAETQVVRNNRAPRRFRAVNRRAAKSLEVRGLAPQVGFEPTTLRLTATPMGYS